MKKVIGILFLLVLMVTFTLGQSVSEVWIIPADDTNAAAWQAAGNARGIDINTASTTTGNTVLYADNVKKTVHVHNAADGSYIHSLDTTGIVGSGIFGWLDPYRVAVTQDGQVFACAYDGRVVRWADDAVTTPGALAIDPVADGHTGSSRAFEVVGSGNSVRVFVGKGTDILVYDDDGTGTFAENTTLTIATGWSTECEAIASSDSNLVYASEVGSGSDQKPFRRIYELTAAGYVNNETLVAALPYTTWFQPNGLDVGAGYYILAEAAGDYDGFAIGTIAGANYNPESGDTAPIDNVYDAGMNGASTVADIAFDPATLRAYWTTAGTGATAGIGCIQFNPQTAPAVFFSEYIEGSSNNKALEIYNGTDAAINLPDFRVAQSSNGGGWKYYHTFPEAATLAVGDVWVMLNSDTSPDYYAAADADEVLSYPSAVHHNGDDARGLEWTPDGGTTWHFADIIGDPNNDPGSGWDVAGVTLGTYNHTMVRKATVTSGNTDWAASAGTNATDSEWEVYDQNTFDYLGVHPGTPPPTISSVSATSDTTVEILFSKAIDVTTGETVTNYSIDNGIGNPVLATVSTDTVLLKVATLSGNITYTLTVNNIKDLDANTIEANSTATFVLDTEPAQTGVVVINEVGEPYTMTNTWEDSYIELYNTTDAAIDVSGWVVWSVAVTKGTSSFEFPSGTEIATDGYLIATRDRTKFLVDYGAYVAEAIVPAAAAVTGSGVYIKYDYYFALINQNGDTIDVTGSTIDWNSKTWEKESPELDGSVDDNWHLTYQTAPVEGTPGQPNSTPPPPSPYTIAEIQDTTGSGSDASALVGEGALTKGIVTAVGSGKFVIQDGDSAWSAIWVNNSTTVTLGDSVEVEAMVAENYGFTELNASAVTIINSGNTVPAPIALTTGAASAEMYESVLLSVSGACDNPDLGYGEWSIDDGSGSVGFDDLFYAFSPTAGWDYDVTGIMLYSFGAFKILPRDADDIIEHVPDVVLPLFEGATDGTFDLEWTYNEWGGGDDDGDLVIIDSTGSAWASHVIAYSDTGYTGIAHVKDALFMNYTISADIYIVGPQDDNFPLYAGLAVKSAHTEGQYYRFIYRNSTTDNGQLKFQGYDGAAWHISKSWTPGTDFTALETGWHNFKVTVVGNNFWAFIDDQPLSGCPLNDDAPFITAGYPGIFKYNAGVGTVMFDNFSVVEPVLGLMPIVNARVDADGDFMPDLLNEYVTVNGIVISPDFGIGYTTTTDIWIHDGTGGIHVYTGVFKSAAVLGDSIEVTGKIASYNGEIEIMPDAAEDIVVLSSGCALPEPTVITIADIDEPDEAELVIILGVYMVDPSQWPPAGENANVFITDGGPDTLILRIDKDTDLAGWIVPYDVFDVIGIVDQYTSSTPPNDGYQLKPRFQTDFLDAEVIVPIAEMDEGFEDVFPPDGWKVFATNIVAGNPAEPWNKSDNAPVSGTYNAYMSNYNTQSDCWLVTPPIDLDGEMDLLKFYARDDLNTSANDFGSELKVYASTLSGRDAADFVLVSTITEADCYNATPEFTIDLKQFTDADYVFIGFMVHNFGDPLDPNAGGDNWNLDDVRLDSTRVGIDKDAQLPMEYSLSQNYPNPFNPTTNIKLALPEAANVNLSVYNLIGQEVAVIHKGQLQPGYHSFILDASRLASGVYFYKVEANNFFDLKKMTILK